MHFINRSQYFSPEEPSEGGIVAYFSMEIAVIPEIPSYSGGLGVLAGDTLRAAADMGLPLAAVTLAHRKGYFRQHLDGAGTQSEESQPWNPEKLAVAEEPIVTVTIEGRPVALRAWRYEIEGVTGHRIPVYFLDADLEQNDPADRVLTDHLYGGDTNYRLRQEAILGIGGARMLRALEYEPSVYHMNEGHAALLTIPVLEQELHGAGLQTATERNIEAVRRRCVFTTHTPVPAGHDRFSGEQAYRILGAERAGLLERFGCFHDGLLNLTYVALRFSRFVNGVAMQHGKVSRQMFPEYTIDAITNGVHAGTWTAASVQAVFDKHLPRWRQDNVTLRYAIDIPENEIVEAHAASKRALLAAVKAASGVEMKEEIFTLGFARRAATYKRADLLFTDPERLVRLAEKSGGMQILYAGKAHPADEPGKAKIRRVIELSHELSKSALQIVYLENYEWKLGALMTGGVDLWLNTPLRPYEASGTSGMKAALNGVPSLSILDGWWIEGWIEGVTGWAIDDHDDEPGEARSMYEHLEQVILPLYYKDQGQWRRIMRSTIALNGSFFNTQRMLEQYVINAYFPEKLVEKATDPAEPEIENTLAH
ncbi:MAG TPA: alpha-glucan family phosphorylase [Acidobacteriaceae bacterium]|jgi:starch phosphorylase|nr:alpha-glucan family phosphorylase [Acidobacteriaceae bacterium]